MLWPSVATVPVCFFEHSVVIMDGVCAFNSVVLSGRQGKPALNETGLQLQGLEKFVVISDATDDSENPQDVLEISQ